VAGTLESCKETTEGSKSGWCKIRHEASTWLSYISQLKVKLKSSEENLATLGYQAIHVVCSFWITLNTRPTIS